MITTHTRTGAGRRLVVVASLAALLLAGCAGAGDSATSGSPAEAPAAGDAGGGGGGGVGGGGGGVGGGAAADEDGGTGSRSGSGSGSGSGVSVPDRKITRSQVSVQVDDLSRSAQQVRDLAVANGGEVTDESLGLAQTYDGTTAYGPDGTGIDGVEAQPAVIASPGEARLVLRVPPGTAGETVNQIAELGTETGRWTSSTSVETTLVDLESRVESQTRAVQQAQELMARATTLQDIVLLENEVNTRTAELESLTSRLASIEGQADRAIVTAVLQTRERTEAVASTAGFVGGLRSGWNALQASVGVLLTVVGAVLPFAVVATLVGYPVYRLVRRRRASSPVVVPAPAGPAAGWATAPSAPVGPAPPEPSPAPPAAPRPGRES